jgi:hypothetical protein
MLREGGPVICLWTLNVEGQRQGWANLQLAPYLKVDELWVRRSWEVRVGLSEGEEGTAGHVTVCYYCRIP